MNAAMALSKMNWLHKKNCVVQLVHVLLYVLHLRTYIVHDNRPEREVFYDV